MAETAIEELKKYDQWVAWKAKPKPNGKTDKIPINPHTGKNASSNDPTTWGTYQEATKAVEKYGLNGIGFVFTDKDPFVGFDLDDCRDPKSGQITLQAEAYLDKFDSYSEVSPSGRGLRIIVEGKVPGKRKRSGKDIEIYGTGQFLTITGEHLTDTPSTIEDRQKEINEVYEQLFGKDKVEAPRKEPSKQLENGPENLSDEEILSKIRQASNADKFERLYQGNIEGYPSQSEADLGFCNILAFWTQSPSQIDRLFRLSALYRKKWDSRRGDSTYGQDTIKKALANVGETYTPGNGRLRVAEHGLDDRNIPWACNVDDTEITVASAALDNTTGFFMTMADLKRDFSEKINWLWRSHIPCGLPSMISGREGTGKTTVCLQMAKEVLADNPQGVICWLATEGFVQDTVVKMQDMGLDNKRFGIIKKRDGTYKFNFFLNADITEIKKNLATLNQPILAVFVDSLRGATGLDENDPKIKNAMQALNAIVCDNHKGALIYIHHWKKGHAADLLDKTIGSTAITSSVRQILSIIKRSRFVRVIKQAKSNISAITPELEAILAGKELIIRNTTEVSDEGQVDRAEQFLISAHPEMNLFGQRKSK